MSVERDVETERKTLVTGMTFFYKVISREPSPRKQRKEFYKTERRTYR